MVSSVRNHFWVRPVRPVPCDRPDRSARSHPHKPRAVKVLREVSVVVPAQVLVVVRPEPVREPVTAPRQGRPGDGNCPSARDRREQVWPRAREVLSHSKTSVSAWTARTGQGGQGQGRVQVQYRAGAAGACVAVLVEWGMRVEPVHLGRTWTRTPRVWAQRRGKSSSRRRGIGGVGERRWWRSEGSGSVAEGQGETG